VAPHVIGRVAARLVHGWARQRNLSQRNCTRMVESWLAVAARGFHFACTPDGWDAGVFAGFLVNDGGGPAVHAALLQHTLAASIQHGRVVIATPWPGIEALIRRLGLPITGRPTTTSTPAVARARSSPTTSPPATCPAGSTNSAHRGPGPARPGPRPRHTVIFQVRVLAVVQETWTIGAALAVESPDGARHRPEFCATTWYTPLLTDLSANCSLLL
jgi:hypothetical protein